MPAQEQHGAEDDERSKERHIPNDSHTSRRNYRMDLASASPILSLPFFSAIRLQ